MIGRIQPLVKKALRLTQVSTRGFCINVPYLNPSKHNSMRHNPNNVYIDLWDIGEYPEVVDMGSKAPKLYVKAVHSAIVNAINANVAGFANAVAEDKIAKKQLDFMKTRAETAARYAQTVVEGKKKEYYPGYAAAEAKHYARIYEEANNAHNEVVALAKSLSANEGKNLITPEILASHLHRTWPDFLKRATGVPHFEFSDIKDTLLEDLAKTIVVRDSRMTWLREQEVRHVVSLGFFQTYEGTVQEFINDYHELIRELASASNLNTSGAIQQAPSFIELHRKQEFENEGHQGIKDLEEDRNENKFFYNSLMKYLHS